MDGSVLCRRRKDQISRLVGQEKRKAGVGELGRVASFHGGSCCSERRGRHHPATKSTATLELIFSEVAGPTCLEV